MPANKPLLIVICGLMGTGKSTLAAALAKRTGFHLIRSDEVRKALAGVEKGGHRYETFGEGIYSEKFFDVTYDALFEKTLKLLKKGGGVILDASFKRVCYRLCAREVAERFGADFLLIECRCPDEVVKGRLKERASEGTDASDGRWEVFARQKDDFEKVTEVGEEEHLVINTEKGLEENLVEIERVRRRK